MSTTDLSYVVGRGAGLRRGRFARRMAKIWGPLLLFAFANALLYYVFANRNGTFDVLRGWPVLAAMALIPLCVSAAAVSLSRERPAATTIILATVTAFAFAIAGLAALRFTLSFSSVVVVGAVSLIEMLSISARLFSAWQQRVVVLDFEGAEAFRDRLGHDSLLVRNAAEVPPDADVVLIDVGRHYSADWSRYLLRCYMRGIAVLPWTRYLELQIGRVDVASFDITDIAYSPGQVFYSRIKRWVDVALTVLASPIWVPLMAAVALYVRWQAGPGIIFRQQRRGHGERNFTLFKFRTMRSGGGDEPASARDGRVIPALAWLRRCRLDELPQLINVLRGEMSLVGPRPESIELAARYERGVRQYVDRCLVPPGITGWAQVNARASTSMEEAVEKLAFDLYYIKYLSPDLDMLVLVRTLRALVGWQVRK